MEYENKTYTNIIPLLSPEIMSNNSVVFSFSKMELILLARYVGKSYLNNENTATMPAFWSTDVIVNVPINKSRVRLICNNLFNNDYFTSGYVVDAKDYFYVNALRNFMIELSF